MRDTPTFEARLPWIKRELWRSGNLSERLHQDVRSVNDGIVDFIPRHVEIFTADDRDIKRVYKRLVSALQNRLTVVNERLRSLSNDARLPEDEILKATVGASVPWYIVELPEGGLGADGAMSGQEWAMIPCRLYISHAVFWDKQETTGSKVALVTGRLPGKPWNDDDDFLHEIIHASFAPIPIYVQSWHIQIDTKSQALELGSVENLTENHVGWMTYAIPEIVVAYLTNDKRPTETELPVVETHQMLRNFLKLGSVIMPQFGFSETLALHEQYGLTAQTRTNLVSSCIRALSVYDKILASEDPPLEYFKNLSKR